VNAKNLDGLRFGRLVALKRAPNRRYPCGKSLVFWLCRCDCGVEKEITAGYLHSAHTQSCGCRQKELARSQNITHGMRHTPEYDAWTNMIARCTRQNNKRYKDYGGRGIRICDSWLNSFASFYAAIGRRTSPKYSIDRINNDGNYEPGNCRWATPKEQRHNRRDSAR
jgi:hypothetical protein